MVTWCTKVGAGIVFSLSVLTLGCSSLRTPLPPVPASLKVGVTPDKRNAFYCGTGWRGSEAFFNAWLLGWPRVSVFDGGWLEWSNDAENPVETGIPEAPVP